MFFKKSSHAGRYLIVGLGNPGRKYQYTRHNIGYMALEFLAKSYAVRVSRSRFSSLVGEGVINSCPVVLLKPLTYMNLSGQAVAAAVKYYGISPEKIIIICDDIALSPGTIRIREHGSSGGQKGLLSIEDMLGSSEYIRIRIGVGSPSHTELSDHVLSVPTSSERELITKRFPDVVKAVELIIKGEIALAQSRYNGAG